MYFNKTDILKLEKGNKIKFVNSLSGFKGAYLLGTKSNNGINNLGMFTSLVHISSMPPAIGVLFRPQTDEHQSLKNIKESKEFTLNMVSASFVENAHYTSANFPEDVSEFTECGLTTQFFKGFKAPFVKESKLKIGLSLNSIVDIPLNGMQLVIGDVSHVEVDDSAIGSDGQLHLKEINALCATGLNLYSETTELKQYPYARPDDIPDLIKRPEQVVFDKKSKKYSAGLMPYATNVSAPAIEVQNMQTWKKSSVHKFNKSFKNKVDIIKDQYAELVKEFKENDKLYNAKISFEPVIGEIYHLYLNKKGDSFISLIDPEDWNNEFLGSYKLNHDHCWEKVD